MLRFWFDLIVSHGHQYGFNMEASKCWLITDADLLEEAKEVFQGTDVKITTTGKKLLGAAVGSEDFKGEFVNNLLEKWVVQVEMLAEIAAFDPHSAYVAFTSGIRHRYSYYMRTIPNISSLLKPLEDAIRMKLIPALTEGRIVTDDERLLLSLPPRLGGMGIIAPQIISDLEYQLSTLATSKLTGAIKAQLKTLPPEFNEKVKDDKLEVKRLRSEFYSNQVAKLEEKMTPSKKRANEIAREKGASNWLTAIPLEDMDFHLSKREFWDAVTIRYMWPLKRLPAKFFSFFRQMVFHHLT